MKRVVLVILAVILFQIGISAIVVLSLNTNSTQYSDEDDMEEGIVYLTDFSVQYTSAADSPYGEVNENALYEEINGTTQSYYYVMEFVMQTASNIEKMEYLTVELCVLDSDVVETIINYTNTSNTSVKTVDGQTTITATYSLPEKAKALKNVQLVIELKPLKNGASDIVYSFSSDNKSVSGYDQTDCTYSLSDSGVTIGNTSLSYTLNSDGDSYGVSGIGTKGECKYLNVREYWNDLPVTRIEEKAFYDATYITNISIPEAIRYIGLDAFTNTGYYNDESNWEDGVLYIGKCLVATKDDISASCTVKDGTEVISAYAFSENSSLEKVSLPDGLKYINWYAFYKCTSLANIAIPDTVLSFGSYAFAYCSAITDVLIPDSVKKLSSYAFYKCTSLTSVTLGKNITYIGSRAFYDCTALNEINYNVISVETLFNTGTNILGMSLYVSPVFGDSSGKNGGGIKLTIGSAVTAIPEAMFYECEYITSLEFEKNSQCKSIGDRAFSDCISLTSVTLGGSVETIGSYAFYYCTSLTSVTNPDSLTSIGTYAFYQCTSLISITIGSGVTSIGSYAFKNCTKLTSVTFSNTSGWWVSTSSSATSGTTVTVTSASKSATYLTNTYQKYYWRRT